AGIGRESCVLDPIWVGNTLRRLLNDEVVCLSVVTLDSGYDGRSARAHVVLADIHHISEMIEFIQAIDQSSSVCESVLQTWGSQGDRVLVSPRYDAVRAWQRAARPNDRPRLHVDDIRFDG